MGLFFEKNCWRKVKIFNRIVNTPLNFEQISHIVLFFPLLTLNKLMLAGLPKDFLPVSRARLFKYFKN